MVSTQSPELTMQAYFNITDIKEVKVTEEQWDKHCLHDIWL